MHSRVPSLLGPWFPESSHLQLLSSLCAPRKEDRHQPTDSNANMDLNQEFIRFVVLLWAEPLEPIKSFFYGQQLMAIGSFFLDV